MDRQRPNQSRELSLGSPVHRVPLVGYRDQAPRSRVHGPLATPEAIANEPAPFPLRTIEAPYETGFADWRRRLTGNLSRRSDGRWAPLTWTHGNDATSEERIDERSAPRTSR